MTAYNPTLPHGPKDALSHAPCAISRRCPSGTRPLRHDWLGRCASPVSAAPTQCCRRHCHRPRTLYGVTHAFHCKAAAAATGARGHDPVLCRPCVCQTPGRPHCRLELVVVVLSLLLHGATPAALPHPHTARKERSRPPVWAAPPP